MSTCFSGSPPSLKLYMLLYCIYCFCIEMETKCDDDDDDDSHNIHRLAWTSALGSPSKCTCQCVKLNGLSSRSKKSRGYVG